MQITTCLETINDINEMFNDINGDPGKTIMTSMESVMIYLVDMQINSVTMRSK